MPPLCMTVGIQGYENNFMVTHIGRNKGNPPDSRTYDVCDMNGRHSPFSGKKIFVVLTKRSVATKISTKTSILKND